LARAQGRDVDHVRILRVSGAPKPGRLSAEIVAYWIEAIPLSALASYVGQALAVRRSWQFCLIDAKQLSALERVARRLYTETRMTATRCATPRTRSQWSSTCAAP
jgi:hypothetical protein